MFSVKTKLTLSRLSSWGILIASATIACTGLGSAISPILLLINTFSLWLIVIAIEKNPLSPKGSFATRSLAAIYLSSLPLFMYAASFTQGFLIFLSPMLSFYLTSPNKFTAMLFSLSKEREMNLKDESEKWMHEEIDKLAKQENFLAPTIQFLELFENIQSSKDIEKLKRNLPHSLKYLENIKSDDEFIARLKEEISPVAAAMKLPSSDNHIFIGSNLLNHPKIKLSRNALNGILAHEFGHLKHGDTNARLIALLPYTLTIFLSLFSFSLSGLFLSSVAHYAFFALSRAQEALADIYSAKLTSPDNLIEAFTEMQKNKKLPENDGYIEKFVGYYHSWCATHPNLKSRIATLTEFKNEQEKDKKEMTRTFSVSSSPECEHPLETPNTFPSLAKG